MKKKASENTTPGNRGHFLGEQIDNGGGEQYQVTAANPIGSSILPILILGGTRHPRSPLYLKRSTNIARLLKVKLQMTPKA